MKIKEELDQLKICTFDGLSDIYLCIIISGLAPDAVDIKRPNYWW